MTSVYEPDPSTGNLTVQTSYTYTVQDLLTGVTEGSQSRTYTFDDLGRATSVKTPETNEVAYQYQYNNFGLVTQRTDPRGVITTYGYDNLNRLHTISYNVGSTGVPVTPGVTLNYDSGTYGLGRLTSMADGPGSETYVYNNLGEMTSLTKVISSVSYPISYAYNLAEEVTQITYPSGRVVAQSYDPIGRLCSVGASGSACSSGTLYASGFGYNAAMQVTGFTYGNGVVAAFGYSPDRLLLQSLAYTKGATTLFSTNYWYKTDSTHCPTGASGNNGQIQCITDNVDNGRTVAYSYDPLYRLTSAVTTGSAGYVKWGLSWTYDRYGNRQTQTSSFDTPPTNSVTVDAITNRITGSPYAYDANGNMTNDGNNTLTYDAENRVVSTSNGGASGTYTFDGNNIRVKKISGANTTVTIFSGGVDIAEYVNTLTPGSPTNEYIYAGSQRIMSVQGGTTDYWHSDHLSPRLRTNTSGAVADQRGTYPFGENWYPTSGPGFMFTSYARDAESANDYAMARSYVNRLARFSSPDPIGGTSGDPQSLNAYAYTRNDPIGLADPTGLFYKTCQLLGTCGPPTTNRGQDGGMGGADGAGQDPPSEIFRGGQVPGSGRIDLGPAPQPPPPDDPIGRALALLKQLLSQDAQCLQFLSSKGINAMNMVNTIYEYFMYGQAGMLPARNSAGNWSVTNALTWGPYPSTITVNSIGAFYASTLGNFGPLTTDRGRIAGGTPAAQLFILLHEVGHTTNALRPDAYNQGLVDANDKDLEKNCKKTIASFFKQE